MVRRNSEEWAVCLPDNEDVDVFRSDIVFSLLEVEVRRDFREKTCFRFRFWRSLARSTARACGRKLFPHIRRIHHLDRDPCQRRRMTIMANSRPGPHAPYVRRLVAVLSPTFGGLSAFSVTPARLSRPRLCPHIFDPALPIHPRVDMRRVAPLEYHGPGPDPFILNQDRHFRSDDGVLGYITDKTLHPQRQHSTPSISSDEVHP